MAPPFKFESAPVLLPLPLQVTSKFGQRKHPITGEPNNHEAIDIAAPAGTPVLAIRKGRVVKKGLLARNINSGCGEGVVLAHGINDSKEETYTTTYCHLQEGSTSALVEGSEVNAGARIGTVGSTGSSTAPHLHLILRIVRFSADSPTDVIRNDRAIDPEPYLNEFQDPQINAFNRTVVVEQPPNRGITPNIESLESFHPRIQYELTRRRISSETANSYMPFVKLTSLSRVLTNNLPAGTSTAHCPSLGIHGENEVSFDNIYNNKAITERFAQLARLTDVTLTQSNRSIIGYARTQDGSQTVPVIVEDASKDALNVPIPGITQVNVERSTAGPMGVRGGLTRVDLKIVAYSVGQVDALLRYFLRPATRVVLELGRLSSNPKEQPITPFDWRNNETYIRDYFSTLIKSPEKQEEFIKEYIYKNYGNYEIFIAYVVKFNLKYNKNNTFEIDLTLHSVQQVEVPTKHTSVQSVCPSPTSACKSMDIQEYFSDAYSWKNNSFTKLMTYYQQDRLLGDDARWKSQIVPIKNDESDPASTGAGSTQAGTRENEYFVTWKFFVEKILGDRTYGIASMLGNDELVKLALLRPSIEPDGVGNSGLIANEVGYHPNLRSVNPEVMIIWNPIAQGEFSRTIDASRFESLTRVAASGSQDIQDALRKDDLLRKITSASEPFTNKLDREATKAGSSFLTRGVWLNTKSIKQAFTSTDTISSAISMLLNMMSSATEGYWNLQLYSTDVKNPGMHIIDMGLSKEPKIITESQTGGIDREENELTNVLNSIEGVNLRRYHGESEDKPKYIYMFNRGTKRFGDGELGSDLIDLNVEFNLPQVIAVQAIANIGGPAQKGLLNTIDVKQLQEITLIKDLYNPCNNTNVCADEPGCESDEIAELREALTDAEARNRDVIAQERRAPRATDVQLRASDVRLQLAQAQVTAAQDALAEKEVKLFNPNLVNTIREYADLGTALQLIEINPSRMMKQLNLDSTSAERNKLPSKAHAFNSSNLTKTVVDVTLPGIGGINLFQSFLVDRVPSIINRGFYIVTKITHEFTSQNGWITKIQGRFRYKPENTSAIPDDICKDTGS
jgi:hypothetical protein